MFSRDREKLNFTIEESKIILNLAIFLKFHEYKANDYIDLREASTMAHKIFGTNSSFHVKWRKAGKV